MNTSSLNNELSLLHRRSFLINTVAAAGGLALLGSPLAGFAAGGASAAPTVQDIINLILKEGNLQPIKDTVDTIKAGKADQPVTGIITTMFATIKVIEEAARLKANFIIAHEPTFYNHKDDTGWVKDNRVVQQKLDLLAKRGITVWRFHDYCHSLKPDAISYGVAKRANWLPYYKTGELILTIPPVSLQQLVQHLKSSLGITHLRVIGDLNQSCSRIALLPGAWGGQRQVNAAETLQPDVLVVGELSEWETAEYIRDSRLLGGKTALIVLGHSVSEEPGMEWFVDWLQPKIPALTVTHIASGDPFTWM
ncbi:Nif3-like dinuclear metal center hexameric protein [Paraflavitalea sp. CAU 1676]|uniref:Nif3-like dinuclear metal center hexameric protein n=1 Tax=Paraflavitalea sp. CAU 1676 TaxID=3032598 RepID=UPI0023DC2F56|nr:Nif3-like dinuclear metal center hexameric protein [Paraflavitalea sp. CAU 1676]MDF2190373.1 Nif3-like dinuclear metal center hexameric protein [Paraflavitalea sp. CAU 1676]